jgi:predicted GNAT family acetyltransferase
VRPNPYPVDVDEPRVVDNPERKRYELWLGEKLAGVIVYRARPDALALIHTEVEPAFEGQGLGAKLVAGALEDVRRRGLKIVPLCPFVRSYLERHPGDADLIAPRPARSA